MSGDLISRSAFVKAVHNFVEQHRNDEEVQWTGYDWLLKEDSVIDIINNLPAVYDMDKVVERLEEYAHDKICDRHYGCPYVNIENMSCANCGAMGALEIVKSGGIE